MCRFRSALKENNDVKLLFKIVVLYLTTIWGIGIIYRQTEQTDPSDFHYDFKLCKNKALKLKMVIMKQQTLIFHIR